LTVIRAIADEADTVYAADDSATYVEALLVASVFGLLEVAGVDVAPEEEAALFGAELVGEGLLPESLQAAKAARATQRAARPRVVFGMAVVFRTNLPLR
jgi:hypothetical protein